MNPNDVEVNVVFSEQGIALLTRIEADLDRVAQAANRITAATNRVTTANTTFGTQLGQLTQRAQTFADANKQALPILAGAAQATATWGTRVGHIAQVGMPQFIQQSRVATALINLFTGSTMNAIGAMAGQASSLAAAAGGWQALGSHIQLGVVGLAGAGVAMVGLVTGILAVVGPLALLEKRFADAALANDNAAQSVGVSAEKFSEATKGIEMLGARSEDLQKGLMMISFKIREAAIGSGYFSGELAALGMQLRKTDGTFKNSLEVFLELSDRFKNMPDGIRKTGAAMEILTNEVAVKLIPSMNQGSKVLLDAAKKAQELGSTFSKTDAQGVREFIAGMVVLKQSTEGTINMFARAFLPILNKGLQAFIETSNSITEYIRSIRIAGSVTENFSSAADTMVTVLEGLKGTFSDIGEGITMVLNWVAKIPAMVVLAVGMATEAVAAGIEKVFGSSVVTKWLHSFVDNMVKASSHLTTFSNLMKFAGSIVVMVGGAVVTAFTSILGIIGGTLDGLGQMIKMFIELTGVDWTWLESAGIALEDLGGTVLDAGVSIGKTALSWGEWAGNVAKETLGFGKSTAAIEQNKTKVKELSEVKSIADRKATIAAQEREAMEARINKASAAIEQNLDEIRKKIAENRILRDKKIQLGIAQALEANSNAELAFAIKSKTINEQLILAKIKANDDLLTARIAQMAFEATEFQRHLKATVDIEMAISQIKDQISINRENQTILREKKRMSIMLDNAAKEEEIIAVTANKDLALQTTRLDARLALAKLGSELITKNANEELLIQTAIAAADLAILDAERKIYETKATFGLDVSKRILDAENSILENEKALAVFRATESVDVLNQMINLTLDIEKIQREGIMRQENAAVALKKLQVTILDDISKKELDRYNLAETRENRFALARKEKEYEIDKIKDDMMERQNSRELRLYTLQIRRLEEYQGKQEEIADLQQQLANETMLMLQAQQEAEASILREKIEQKKEQFLLNALLEKGKNTTRETASIVAKITGSMKGSVESLGNAQASSSSSLGGGGGSTGGGFEVLQLTAEERAAGLTVPQFYGSIMDPLGGISQNNNFIIEMRKNRELQQAMASSLSESKRKAEEVVGSPTWYQKLRREQQDNQRTELARTSITASLTGGTAGLAVAPSPTTVIPNSTTPSSSNTSSVRIEQGSIDALSAALTRALLNAKIGIYVDKKKVGEVAYDLLRDGTIPAIISRN